MESLKEKQGLMSYGIGINMNQKCSKRFKILLDMPIKADFGYRSKMT